ncbi:MAG TPA: hypothetical protein VJT79_10565, partial [Pseudonocardia sp.]|nr:hypothetical protein [Pseudonocardia sp.]
KVVDTGPVYAAPARDADVVGTAAQRAGVPVECVTEGWLRIGVGQFVPAAAVKVPSRIAPCGSAASSR